MHPEVPDRNIPENDVIVQNVEIEQKERSVRNSGTSSLYKHGVHYSSKPVLFLKSSSPNTVNMLFRTLSGSYLRDQKWESISR